MVYMSSIIGHELAKTALLLLAINPRLGGVVLAGARGTAKTHLLRAGVELLQAEQIVAIATCRAACDPAQPAYWCAECRSRYHHTPPEVTVRAAPIIELPVHTSVDRLLGGLDLEATLALGRRVAAPGVLACAHRGVLLADQLNLQDDEATDALLATLSARRVQLERDGISADYPAYFVVLGGYDPAEGQVRRALLDSVGMLVPPEPLVDAGQRSRMLRYAHTGLPEDAARMQQGYRTLVQRGRALLPQVLLPEDILEALANEAVRLCVEGNRADIFAAECVAASAALHGRITPEQTDLDLAMHLVLLPRANEQPPPQAQTPQAPQREEESRETQSPEPIDSPDGERLSSEEQILDALDSALPRDLLAAEQFSLRQGRSGSRGQTQSRRRGRHIRSLPGSPRHGRVAIPATLLAAAPFQRARRSAAAPPGITILPQDIRLKQYRTKAGTLFIFAVDASGSMALNRMRHAKGAVTSLLQEAYINRDRVALVAFRGTQAQVLLPPSQSVELAKRALDVLPVGGATPLAAGLQTAYELARLAQRSSITQTMLILLTDGRANVPSRPAQETATSREHIAAEIAHLARSIVDAGIRCMVIDTQRSYGSSAEARQLADLLGGRYLRLPDTDGSGIATAVKAYTP